MLKTEVNIQKQRYEVQVVNKLALAKICCNLFLVMRVENTASAFLKSPKQFAQFNFNFYLLPELIKEIIRKLSVKTLAIIKFILILGVQQSLLTQIKFL